MKPKEVNKSNEEFVLRRINSKTLRPANKKPSKFKVEDHVRISKLKGVFEKGYLPNWSNQIFVINTVHSESRPVTYKLVDRLGQEIEGRFYEHELAITKHPDKNLIEKILRRKGNKVLVKWDGLDNSYNEWVDKSAVDSVL